MGRAADIVQPVTPLAPDPVTPGDIPPRLRFDRIDTSSKERPTFDDRAARRQKLASILGLVGTITAGRDRPTLSGIASGIARGAGMNLEEMEGEYADRMQGWEDWLAKAEDYNREVALKEAEADFELRRGNYEARRDADIEEQAAVRRHERDLDRLQFEDTLERALIKWKRGLPLTEAEKEELRIKGINAEANLTRARTSAERENRLGDSSSGSGRSANAKPLSFEQMQSQFTENQARITRLEQLRAGARSRETIGLLERQIAELEADNAALQFRMHDAMRAIPAAARELGMTPEMWQTLTPEQQAEFEEE